MTEYLNFSEYPINGVELRGSEGLNPSNYLSLASGRGRSTPIYIYIHTAGKKFLLHKYLSVIDPHLTSERGNIYIYTKHIVTMGNLQLRLEAIYTHIYIYKHI